MTTTTSSSECRLARFAVPLRLSRWVGRLALGVCALTSGATWAQDATESAKRTRDVPYSFDRFGQSVAASGDTIVAVAPGDETNSYSGSAWVFVRSGGSWVQQAKLTAGTSSHLGSSVSEGTVSIDGDTVVVGGAGSSSGIGGGAYVFVRTGSTWSQQAELTPGDTADGEFGSAVSVAGDTIVVGRPLDDDRASYAGAAYVFVRSGGVWSEQAKLTASDAEAFDHFGWSVAVDADTAVIGVNATEPAFAYVFVRSAGLWTEQAKLVASDAAPGDQARVEVAIDGETIVVGAPFASNQGAAYVFTRSGTSWTEQAKLTMLEAADFDQFGKSVSVDGELAVVGAQVDRSAHVFRRSGTTWTRVARLLASDGATNDQLGWSASIDGDTIAVGAPGDDNPLAIGVTDAGALYVYDLGDTDADGLRLLEELAAGTRPDRADTDFDGLLDGTEVALAGGGSCPDPLRRDSDGDTHSDGDEIAAGTDPCLADRDADGLSDADEVVFGTDPNNPDTDDDGILDGAEVDVAQGTGCPSPLNPDSDGDFITDGHEATVSLTDPCNPDTDADGLLDSIDPDPLTRDDSSGPVELATRSLADLVDGFTLGAFTGPNEHIRRNWISSRIRNAANKIAAGEFDGAIQELQKVLVRIDDDATPPDWMVPSPERDVLGFAIVELILTLT